MKQCQSFIFDSYSLNRENGEIELRYKLDNGIRFLETITLSKPIGNIVDEAELNRALFLLHLFGGISYYKTCCPKKIEVRSGKLTKDQAEFWNTVYTKGLGQFFYENKINFLELINFPTSVSPAISMQERQIEGSSKTLVPVGGGKDSVVTIEKLRTEEAAITLFRMGTHSIIEELAKIADLPLLSVKRQLSRKLFELNEEGAFNGHVPITGYLSALTIVIALLYEFDTVSMSNEKSASEGNVEYLGEDINHQWSKGEEFEKMFRGYVRRWVTPNVRYENPLRKMTELEIAGEFAKYPQYFSYVTSCNTNWRILEARPKERWCNTCPKCAFVFTLLAMHMDKKTVLEMFGKNLFENAELIPLYKELLGIEGHKPFECVGTAEEVKEAFQLIHERGEYEDTPIMQLYLSQK